MLQLTPIELESLLIESYAKISAKNAAKLAQLPLLNQNSQIIASALSNHKHLQFYDDPTAVEIALDTIDLPKIYSGVDEREKSNDGLGYEDHLVLETLRYFKEDFFRWINKPECPNCRSDGDNMESLGAGRPTTPGPHLIGVIEQYRCRDCSREVSFPRMNNPVSLLETRRGRCGEWVNCFMLVLKAVLGTDLKLRYIWNYEDHVWCEYYSRALQKWIHLDPCENSWNEPSLYCNNWGKKMSWVIGVGDDLIVDLSSKYVTSPEKCIAKSLVADERQIKNALRRINAKLAHKLWTEIKSDSKSESECLKRFYDTYLLRNGREQALLRSATATKDAGASATDAAVKGRQSGSSEWTASRGEDGSS
ncbi:hypothetical protein PUMCH_004031 [Australozyma saopauloensis]|uniref:Peptide:N-glycanase 1 n=1 Tax=Australozyma saopauloensis TaxID=291208 RepID=A0AAX4HDG8_9ASCO|nr:hypothetical protein PUMCH_004031 [[Candida] saopauloensis]